MIDLTHLNTPGIVVWELPPTMKTLVESMVKVRIATIAHQAEAVAGIDTTKKNSGSKRIAVTEKMKVSLLPGKGSDFIIEPKDSIHKITDEDYAEWYWNVTPLQSGTRYLILKVAQVKVVDGKEIPGEEKTVLSKQFEVKITAPYIVKQVWEFIKANWVLLSAIITFFVGLFIRKKINDGKKTDP